MKKHSALQGIQVLDLSRVLAGPLCTMMLADMGADVIKIEMPKKGDDSRTFGPFQKGESAYFMNMNRNKKGITLNLKGEGQKLFLAMVKKADIVVENYRPGVMEKLGIGYEELKKINPQIIYGAVSGFGHTGPYRLRPGYDIIGQAMSGLMSTTGWPESGPTRIGTPMSDTLAGLSVTIGILGALQYRNATGIGQKVDISLMDSGMVSMQVIQTYFLCEGRLPERIGNRYESNYPTDSFLALDGHMVIGAANDKLWQGLCRVIGLPDLAFNENMDTNPKRVQNHAVIKPFIEEWTKTKTVKEAVDALLAAGVPAAPINDIEALTKDPHVKSRKMFVEMEHPKAGKITVTGSHIKLSETETRLEKPSPNLGEHNEEIYGAWLGLSKEQIEIYKEQGII